MNKIPKKNNLPFGVIQLKSLNLDKFVVDMTSCSTVFVNSALLVFLDQSNDTILNQFN